MTRPSPQYARVKKLRGQMVLDHPYFGVLSLGLTLTEDPTCETAWTDGGSLGFSPSFIDTLSDDQVIGLIAHEVMHCAAGHPWRRAGRDPERWNVAADLAINPILKDAGFTLPDGALLDPQYRGKWAEWIHDRLPAKPPQPQGGSGQGQGQPDPNGQPQPADKGFGEVRDAPTDTNAPTQADWQRQVEQAARTATGKLPAGLKETIIESSHARVDWHSLLIRWAQDIARSDYSWTRPNRRYVPSGLYLPALHSREFGTLAIGIDTSSSMDTVVLGHVAATVNDIADQVKPREVIVYYCDTKVHRVDRFAKGERIVFDAIGRGGTSFVPVFERIEQDAEQPAGLIYLTDLDGRFPQVEPEYPVIWAAYGRPRTAPFGDVIPCE